MQPDGNPYPDPSEPQPPRKGGNFLGRALIDLLETIAPAFVIALLINLFLAQSTYVYGHSMEPNLHTDQRLVVEKVSYKLHPPHRGDIVVIDV
jgi:signal peptidase I